MLQYSRKLLLPALSLLVCANAQSDPVEEILKQAIGRHQAGDIEGAIEAYRKYLAARPDSPMALSNLGAAYARVARYEEAIAQYREILRLDSGNAGCYIDIATSYAVLGKPTTNSSPPQRAQKSLFLCMQSSVAPIVART